MFKLSSLKYFICYFFKKLGSFVKIKNGKESDMPMYNAFDIAHKILSKPTDAEEFISNMKLQKLLYYMQGFHIALFGVPLFKEDIEAWMYGPVIPSVYHKYEEFGRNGIEPEKKDPVKLTAQQERLFEEVYRVYGSYSALGLMNMTHDEMPWKSTNVGKGNIITTEKLGSFFKKRLA